MRLIDADVFKENMDYICDAGGWLEPVTKAVREFVKRHIDAQTTVKPEPHWTPCSERLPEELVPVNITWVNHEPESYYEDIKDKPFSATGIGSRWNKKET